MAVESEKVASGSMGPGWAKPMRVACRQSEIKRYPWLIKSWILTSGGADDGTTQMPQSNHGILVAELQKIETFTIRKIRIVLGQCIVKKRRAPKKGRMIP